ncbi:MAG TPA: carboxypeptidase-like regulatory domain-containing protein [Flavobacteriaceae bacterium]|nr:carboxypeptidase-like regulatory domain-containing protein [Flavobacteriaceae bacterium]
MKKLIFNQTNRIIAVIFMAMTTVLFTACSSDDDGNADLDGPSGTVTGKVTAANGTTVIPGASVTIKWSNMDDPNLPRTTTDSQGNYSLEGVPEGSQTIVATRGIFQAEVAVDVLADAEVEAPVAALEATGNLAYLQGSYDSIENVVQDMLGHNIDAVESSIFMSQAAMEDYRMIFVNCGSNAMYAINNDDDAIQNIRQWINNGGILYASDLELDFVMEVFPEFVMSQGYGSSGSTTASVVSAPLADFINKDEVDIVYNLGGWSMPSQISSDVEVLIYGPYPGGSSDEGNLAISFQHGQGELVYTSFHNSASATADQHAVLTYYVYGFGEDSRSMFNSGDVKFEQVVTPHMHQEHKSYAKALKELKK